jgi:phospholipid-binding lipoprotein MlaA
LKTGQGNFMDSRWRTLLTTMLLGSLLALAGCASGPQANAADPLEPLNRSIHSFNEELDRAILKPVATTYKDVVPSPMRTGVNNFFDNLRDAWSMVNNALQLKPQQTIEMGFRVGINTFIGLFGLLDVATEMDIPRSSEDFGQTLGYWGMGSGPYLVLPLFGPSTLRDGISNFTADKYGDAVARVDHIATRNSATGLRILDKRTQLLKAEDFLDGAALDKYSFIRDSYLQVRKNQIYDGNPPPEKE